MENKEPKSSFAPGGCATIPRVVIAAVHGGSGKTITTLGLLRAWRREGKSVVPFKKGPDYIDAGWLAVAAGHPCYNLDPFLMTRPTVLRSFSARAGVDDISVIEGNRGIYDGVDEKGSFSTAELAKWLDAPVILTLDCTKITCTAAAVVLGCMTFDPSARIGGIILNRIAHARHEEIIRRSIEAHTGLPVLGAIPRIKHDPLPMRHLGVLPCPEHPEASTVLEAIGDLVKDNIDLGAVLHMARSAPPFPDHFKVQTYMAEDVHPPSDRPRIGILKDEAFQFYYPENIEALEAAGADVIFIDSLGAKAIPDIHALYIGGGFPETLAERLAANTNFLKSLRTAIHDGLPVYAECGGLMYLGRSIRWEGRDFPMVGALGLDFVLSRRPAGHGYSVLEIVGPNPFFESGTVLKGHEFHYSRPVNITHDPQTSMSCRVLRGHGFDGREDGITFRNVFGTYTHLHALATPEWAARVVRAARRHREQL